MQGKMSFLKNVAHGFVYCMVRTPQRCRKGEKEIHQNVEMAHYSTFFFPVFVFYKFSAMNT